MKRFTIITVILLSGCTNAYNADYATSGNYAASNRQATIDSSSDNFGAALKNCDEQKKSGKFKTYTQKTQCVIAALEKEAAPTMPDKLAIRKLEQQLVLIAVKVDHKKMSVEEANAEGGLKFTEMLEVQTRAENAARAQQQSAAAQERQQNAAANQAITGMMQNSLNNYQQRAQDAYSAGRPKLTCNTFGGSTTCY